MMIRSALFSFCFFCLKNKIEQYYIHIYVYIYIYKPNKLKITIPNKEIHMK